MTPLPPYGESGYFCEKCEDSLKYFDKNMRLDKEVSYVSSLFLCAHGSG